MKYYATSSRGFTLIELMIVIAIIAILAVIAVPAYITYTQRAKFSEVVHATAPFKLGVEVCYQKTSDLTLCSGTGANAGAGTIPPAISGNPGGVDSYVDSIDVASGVITATSTSAAFGGSSYTYILEPKVVLSGTTPTGQLTWDDSKGTCKAKGLCS